MTLSKQDGEGAGQQEAGLETEVTSYPVRILPHVLGSVHLHGRLPVFSLHVVKLRLREPKLLLQLLPEKKLTCESHNRFIQNTVNVRSLAESSPEKACLDRGQMMSEF